AETENLLIPGNAAGGGVCQTRTRRSGLGKGRGSSSTALTTEKIAVLAPIPRASTATAARAKPGLLASSLSPCRRSCASVAMNTFLQGGEGHFGCHRRRDPCRSQQRSYDALPSRFLFGNETSCSNPDTSGAASGIAPPPCISNQVRGEREGNYGQGPADRRNPRAPEDRLRGAL